MIPHISTTNTIHWVDRIKIEIYPLMVEGQETNQIVQIWCYAEDHVGQDHETAIFTTHKFVETKIKKKEEVITILIEKKEGKDG